MHTPCNDLSSQHTSCVNWFNSRISSTEIINKSNQETLFTLFNASTTDDQVIVDMISHQETAFLHRSMVVWSRQLSTFHHLVSTEGNLYNALTKEYGFFHGVGKSTTMSLPLDVGIWKRVPSDTAVQVTHNVKFVCSLLFNQRD